MGDEASAIRERETAQSVVVHFWAAARAAAGTDQERVPLDEAKTVADLLETVRRRHADRPRLADVLSVCSVLVGDRPVGTTDPADVVLQDGDTVELLPPFAGG